MRASGRCHWLRRWCGFGGCGMVEPAAFDVFKIAPNGRAGPGEGASSLDAAVARVVRLGECFPGEYMIASQASGRRILFTKQGVIKRS